MSTKVLLQSWKEISAYMGRTERTLQRWEQKFGLPVHRPAGRARSAVVALADEIEVWMRAAPSLPQIRRTAVMNAAKVPLPGAALPGAGVPAPGQFEGHPMNLMAPVSNPSSSPGHADFRSRPEVIRIRLRFTREKNGILRENLRRLVKEQCFLCNELTKVRVITQPVAHSRLRRAETPLTGG